MEFGNDMIVDLQIFRLIFLKKSMVNYDTELLWRDEALVVWLPNPKLGVTWVW